MKLGFEETGAATSRLFRETWVERYQGTGRRGFREETRDDYRRMLERYTLRRNRVPDPRAPVRTAA